jgi:hypothetical protein
MPTREAVLADLLLRYARHCVLLDEKDEAIAVLKEAEKAQGRGLAEIAAAKAE